MPILQTIPAERRERERKRTVKLKCGKLQQQQKKKERERESAITTSRTFCEDVREAHIIISVLF
jgi:hypothetical protein